MKHFGVWSVYYPNYLSSVVNGSKIQYRIRNSKFESKIANDLKFETHAAPPRKDQVDYPHIARDLSDLPKERWRACRQWTRPGVLL